MIPSKLKVAFIDTAADVYNKAEADWLKAIQYAYDNSQQALLLADNQYILSKDESFKLVSVDIN